MLRSRPPNSIQILLQRNIVHYSTITSVDLMNQFYPWWAIREEM